MWNKTVRFHTSNKKHVYKERKETTHVEVGGENTHNHTHTHTHTHTYIYISKISTMYVNIVTRLMYKKKEVSIPPNKMKHISPLQRHVFLPLTCRILKRIHIFSTLSPFFYHDWQRIQEVIMLHSRNIKMIKDDQGGTKNP